MSMARRARKRRNLKKCISSLGCIRSSVSSNKESIKRLYGRVVEMMRVNNPNFVDEPLQEEDDAEPRRDSIQRVDQEVQVSMEEFNFSMEMNETSTPLPHETLPVANGFSVPNNLKSSPIKPPNRSKKTSNASFDPKVVIKVEDSGSDDSNHSEERKMAEHLLLKMTAPCFVPTDPMSPKSFLHYVVIENLPIRTTADEVVNELFVELLDISREEVTGITVHNDKTESIAQIYFKELKHVRKILVFSGKLVFKGRVWTSKIGKC